LIKPPFNAIETHAGDVEEDPDAFLPPAWADLRRRWEDLAVELAGRGVLLCPPQACALHDELARRAKAGDEEARADLLAAVPRDLPAAVVRAHRDAALRAMAGFLIANIPGMSISAAASFLATAGDQIERGRRLGDRSPFARLLPAERAALEVDIRRVQAWSKTPEKWVKRRQLLNILLGKT